MLIDEKIQELQNLTKRRITYEELAPVLGLGSGSALRNWAYRKRELKQFEIEKIDNAVLQTQNTMQQDDCINFPVLGEVNASMGYGVTVYDENQTGTYAISRKLASDLGVKPESSDIIFGTGNSMEPTIKGGDALLVDKTRRDICDGKIYCIRQDGQLKAKRLQKLSKTKVKIISDNKDYEPITIDLAQETALDFEVIGEIRWCGRIFL